MCTYDNNNKTLSGMVYNMSLQLRITKIGEVVVELLGFLNNGEKLG